MYRRLSTTWLAGLAACCVAAIGGCGREHYRKDADTEVYRIVDDKRAAVPLLEGPLKLEDPPEDPLADLPRVPVSHLTPGTAPTTTRPASRPAPAVLIGMTAALELAARNNREYQRRKEDVYLTSLDLTLERHRFNPIFAARVGGNFNSSPATFTDNARPGARIARDVFRNVVAGAMTPLVGAAAAGAIGQGQPDRTSIHHDQSISADSNVGVEKMLAGGGVIVMDIATQLLRHLTGDPRQAAGSILTLDFIQPLLRGAGRKIVQENLTQAERNVLYELREFARFRQTFAVSIATEYYRLLQARDGLRNAVADYERAQVSHERMAALAEAARQPKFQVDQAQQRELTAKNGFVLARQRFEESLDDLKISLGIPTEVVIELDYAELDRLRAAKVRDPKIALATAAQVAIVARMDLANLDARAEDATRRVEVAADGLGADLTLVTGIDVGTSGPTQPAKFRLDRATYGVGLDLDLPLDRKAERNAYRQAIIELERRKRDHSLARDTIILAVRNAYRGLQQARESLAIQRLALGLAEQRVESTPLLVEAMRADVRDVLESQAALLEAQNGVTRALIDHTIARLNFYRDVGILRVTPSGILKEPDDYAIDPS